MINNKMRREKKKKKKTRARREEALARGRGLDARKGCQYIVTDDVDQVLLYHIG
jgi:hypothetical protein